jgi:hypothetical protein
MGGHRITRPSVLSAGPPNNPRQMSFFRAQATFRRRGTLRGVELWEVRMTITLFDPRTGKPVTITVPDRPSLQQVIRTVSEP